MNTILTGWYTTIFDNYAISISWFNRSFNMDAVIRAVYVTNVNSSFPVGRILEGDSFCWEMTFKTLGYVNITY